MREAYFAGGCFWCITPVYARMPGVRKVVCGYSGGTEKDPTYEQVKHQQTSHRETVMVEYDEEQAAFSDLLETFLSTADLFDEGGQFIDRGHSYTLAVYVTSPEEKEQTLRRLSEIEELTGKKTYVAVEPFTEFWRAEEYHQDYYKKNPEAFERELIESGRKK